MELSKFEKKVNLTIVKKKTKSNYKMKKILKYKWLYVMMIFPLIYLIIFNYIPIYGLTLAFKKYTVSRRILDSEWEGFKYFNSFVKAPYFWQVLKNTIWIGLNNLIWGFPAPAILALIDLSQN